MLNTDLITQILLTSTSDTTTKKIAIKVCPKDKKRFFEWLSEGIKKMAKELNTDEDFLFALAAREGGWTDEHLDHNQPLNNPFGVNRINKKGEAAGNKSYKNIEEAIEEWKAIGQGIKFGDRVRDTQTIQDFIDGLQCKKTTCRPYNSVNPNYERDFKEIYKSVVKYKTNCGYD